MPVETPTCWVTKTKASRGRTRTKSEGVARKEMNAKSREPHCGSVCEIERLFIVVLARDGKHVKEKIEELDRLGVPYSIICGERIDHPAVVYRRQLGKYDAVNYSLRVIPKEVNVVVYNDVDTRIVDHKLLLNHFSDESVGMVYAPVITKGPQATFYKIFNPIRGRIPLSASGELMAVRRDLLERVLPIKPCKAEDTYLMFKTLELGKKVAKCDECIVFTERTNDSKQEQRYKRRTVTGIYQALSYTKPPALVRIAYFVLPVVAPLLLILGAKGYYIAKGILLGALDYLRRDRSGTWSEY
jgi:cellulose synthase/poly-beta-1,6-N-acetylglucosamine synthase-like glycosyltransferase